MKKKLLAMSVRHERELREKDIQAIQHEREMRVIADTHERELRLVAEQAVESARAIQFNEYERRLTALNHAHEQAVEAAANTVPREVYNNYIKEASIKLELALQGADTRVNTLAKEVEVERSARIRLEGSIGTWRYIAGGSGLVATALAIYTFFGPQ